MQTKNDIIKAIERTNNSKVICYITNDNPLFTGTIADDIFPIFFEILEKIGKVPRIDLFLYSN